MGSFKDLPKDVVWLIFRQVILNHFNGYSDYEFYENRCAFGLGFGFGNLICSLSLISRVCLKTIQTKTRRLKSGGTVGFLLVKGSFS